MTCIRFLKSLAPACAVLLIGGGALLAATDNLQALTEEGARRLQAAHDKPPINRFVAEDMNQHSVTIGTPNNVDESAVTLIGFIYTTCPTICQTGGSDFAILRDRLRSGGLGDHVKIVSLSFDPARDTPNQLKEYGDVHEADGAIWTVARPDAEDLPSVIGDFGIRVIPDEFGGYQHNAAAHLVDKDGRLVGIFDTDDTDSIVAAIQAAQ